MIHPLCGFSQHKMNDSINNYVRDSVYYSVYNAVNTKLKTYDFAKQNTY